MSWASETATMAAVDRARILAVDFDKFLTDPSEGLAHLIAHFGVEAAALEIGAAHGAEIARGQRWLEGAAKTFAPVAAAIQRFGG